MDTRRGLATPVEPLIQFGVSRVCVELALEWWGGGMQLTMGSNGLNPLMEERLGRFRDLITRYMYTVHGRGAKLERTIPRIDF